MTPDMPSGPTGLHHHASPLSVDETLHQLGQVLHERGLTEFAHFDHSGEAAKVGLTMQPAHVLVFGNPRAGTPLMIASPLVALDLPLKVLVWQDATGHVWVSHAEPAWLAQRYTLPPELSGVLQAVEAVVESAVRGTPATT